MDFLNNFDLLSVGLTTAAIGILAYAVFASNRRSVTNQAFLFFAVITVMWGWVNYSSYQIHGPVMTLWLNRLTIFFGTWHAFGILQFFYIYPSEIYKFDKFYKFVLTPLAFIVSLVTLTPLALISITKYLPDGRAGEIANGPGMALFGLFVFCFVIGAIVILARKLLLADGPQKKQLGLILAGTLLTFSLLLSFNFVLPSVFARPRFIPLGMVWILPFIAFSAYAIIRHGLFNIKVAATEFLIFALVVVTFFEVTISKDIVSLIFRIAIFVSVFFFGLLLIRSVRNEISQREKLEVISKKLRIANLRLKELDQQKTEFLSIASHQLRTPLSVVNGYLELLKDGDYGKPTKGMIEVLDNMEISNGHLVKLIDNFLDVSRIEQGRTKFNFTQIDLCKLIAGVVEELRQRAEDKGLKINWQAEACPIIKVEVDEEKIRHVVFNFIDNAIKYSDSGSIKVIMTPEEEGFAVKIKDQGIGFDKTDEVNFFQKFYRGENVKGINVNGTGLGLYVCRKFIETHNGRIWAHSQGKGHGSEFGFWLPFKRS